MCRFKKSIFCVVLFLCLSACGDDGPDKSGTTGNGNNGSANNGGANNGSSASCADACSNALTVCPSAGGPGGQQNCESNCELIDATGFNDCLAAASNCTDVNTCLQGPPNNGGANNGGANNGGTNNGGTNNGGTNNGGTNNGSCGCDITSDCDAGCNCDPACPTRPADASLGEPCQCDWSETGCKENSTCSTDLWCYVDTGIRQAALCAQDCSGDGSCPEKYNCVNTGYGDICLPSASCTTSDDCPADHNCDDVDSRSVCRHQDT